MKRISQAWRQQSAISNNGNVRVPGEDRDGGRDRVTGRVITRGIPPPSHPRHQLSKHSFNLPDDYSFNSTFGNQSDDDLISAALDIEQGNICAPDPPPTKNQSKNGKSSDYNQLSIQSRLRPRVSIAEQSVVQRIETTAGNISKRPIKPSYSEKNSVINEKNRGRTVPTEDFNPKVSNMAMKSGGKDIVIKSLRTPSANVTRKAGEQNEKELRNDQASLNVANASTPTPTRGGKVGDLKTASKTKQTFTFDTHIESGSRNIVRRGVIRSQVSDLPGGSMNSPLQMSTPAERSSKSRIHRVHDNSPLQNSIQFKASANTTPLRAPVTMRQPRGSVLNLGANSPKVLANKLEPCGQATALDKTDKTGDEKMVCGSNILTSKAGQYRSPLKGTSSREKTESLASMRQGTAAGSGERSHVESSHTLTPQRVSPSRQESGLNSSRLLLSSWGLPQSVEEGYAGVGIREMFPWQVDCLCSPGVLEGGNLVYSAPTSAGKTLVAEILLLKRVLETKRKGIIILPFVSVAREKTLHLQHLFDPVGVKVEGFMGGRSPAGGFAAVDVAICTIEKANSLINRLLNDGEINKLGTVVVDELHMVGDDHRGYLLELLLTKIRYMSRSHAAAETQERNGEPLTVTSTVQIIGMSATLPNLDLLGRWLNATVYVTDYRPIPLTECVKIGKSIYDRSMKKLRDISNVAPVKAGDDEHVLSLCMETLEGGRSVLIFCPTKNWCEKLALNLAGSIYRLNKLALETQTGPQQTEDAAPSGLILNKLSLRDVIEQLRRAPVALDKMLAQAVPQGVAFHHAGLTFDERDIVESAFRHGSLRVLVATSTLSSGVNLPARRVIIRTPTFHGKIIDTRTYKQMVGRAGRKGVDTEGESILVCKESERAKARTLLSSDLSPVHSCLLRHQGGDTVSSSMKRAILEVVVSGVASCPDDVQAYAACTMLAAESPERTGETDNGGGNDGARVGCSRNLIDSCIKFLADSEFIILKKNAGEGGNKELYEATLLGKGVLASALSPDEGLIVFAELQRARRNFVLENELHIIYQVTPIYQVCTTIDWYHYMCLMDGISPGERRVAECVGVSESFLARCVQGRVPSSTPAQQRSLAIHRRFYTALVLQELVQETPLSVVADRYHVTRGVLQSLQQAAATFSGMVTSFCSQLGWTNLELLLAQFQARLTFGIQRELTDLVRVSLLNARRARTLYNAGLHTVAALAHAQPGQVEALLRASVPFESKRRAEEESEWERGERQKVRCISVSGQKGLSEAEAAVMIIEEARELVEADLGMAGIQWTKVQARDAANPGKSQDETSSEKTATSSNEKVTEQAIIKPPSEQVEKRSAKSEQTILGVEVKSGNKNESGEISNEIKSPKMQTTETKPETSGQNLQTENPSLSIVPQDGNTGPKKDLNNVHDNSTPLQKKAKAPAVNQSSSIHDQNVSVSNHDDTMNSPICNKSIKVSLHDQCILESTQDQSVDISAHNLNMNEVEQGHSNNTSKQEEKPSNLDQGMNRSIQDTSAELYTEPMEDFNDSFVFDTQLADMVTDTKLDVGSENSTNKELTATETQNPDNKINPEPVATILNKQMVQPSSWHEAVKVSSQENNGKISNKIISGPKLLPKPPLTTSEKSGDVPECETNTTSKVLPSKNMTSSKTESVSLKQEQIKPAICAPLDFSVDDDLEMFMDCYSTQDTGYQSNPCLINKPPVPDKVPKQEVQNSHLINGNEIKETVLCSSFTESPDLAEGNVMSSEYTVRVTFEELMEEFREESSPVRMPLLEAEAFKDDGPSQLLRGAHRKHQTRNLSHCEVTQTEELAYVSILHDTSTVPELEDEDDGQLEGCQRGVDDNVGGTPKQDDVNKNAGEGNVQERAVSDNMDLSQYFEENFGSYTSCLNDSWSFLPPNSPKPGRNITRLAETTESKPSTKQPDHHETENKGVKRKGEEMKSDATPGKQRRMDGSGGMETPQQRGKMKDKVSKGPGSMETPEQPGKKERKDGDSKSPNTSDCVPPTPPQPSTGNTPKTQYKKSQHTQKRAKGSAKKKLNEPTQTGQKENVKNRRKDRKENVKEGKGRLERVIESDKGPPVNECPTVSEHTVTRNVIQSQVAEPSSKEALPFPKNPIVCAKESTDKNVQKAVFQDKNNLSARSQAPPVRAQPSLSQLQPLTNENFTIIDVAASEVLFNHFLEEWSQTARCTLCLACEQFVQTRTVAKPVITIGGRFQQGHTSVVNQPVIEGSDRGLVVDGTELRLVGVAVSWGNRDAYYVSLLEEVETDDLDDSLSPPPPDPSLSPSDRIQAVMKVLTTRTSSSGTLCKRVMFDMREQIKTLARATGQQVYGDMLDPKVAMWLLDPGAKEMSLHRMVHNKLPLDTYLMEGLGGGIGLTSLGLSPSNPGSARVRSCIEAVVVGRLMMKLEEDLASEELLKAFEDVEMPTQVLLASMELNGFGFSEVECDRQKAMMLARLEVLEEEAYHHAGRPFSLSSPDDIAQVLFIELKLPPSGDPLNPITGCKTLGPARGRRGKRIPFSTSKDVLEKLRVLHPLPGLVLEWRRISMAMTKVVFPLTKERVYSETLQMSRIFSLCQTHTATGRVSMSEPNLQNIPNDFEIDVSDQIIRQANQQPRLSVSMRHAFVPYKGGVILAADYSQLELRIIAHLSGDKRLITILNEGSDVFKLIAAEWKGIEIEQVTSQHRQQAKQVCYGMLYGIGAKALGEQLSVSEEEAAVFMDTFKDKYRGLRTFLRTCVTKCRDQGYVETIYKRRRYLPAIRDNNIHAKAHAERQAVNTTVQGSAADLVKMAMVKIEQNFSANFPNTQPFLRHKYSLQDVSRGAGSSHVTPRPYLLLQLHDELFYEVSSDILPQVAYIIKVTMETAMTLDVRLPVKVKSGPSWGKLTEMEI